MRFLALVAVAAVLAGSSDLVRAQSSGPDSADPAQRPKAVVELFTSQGCSSCPAADALLGRLAGRDDIIALSLSVDYWDYLGWKDTLASPKFSERQKAYGQARGDGAIYTPQVVVNGVVHANGSDESKIARAIDKTAKTLTAMYVPIKMSEDKGRLVIEAGASPQGALASDATLWLVVMSKSVQVPIQRGENKGSTVTYHNVVRELTPIGMWSGKPMTVHLERQTFMRPGTDRCAVLLQKGRAGPIIGAALMNQF